METAGVVAEGKDDAAGWVDSKTTAVAARGLDNAGWAAVPEA
jgi:hypothetical protein